MTTEKPTSEGIAEMLSRLDLKGHRLGLQLYPDKDHSVLIGAIKAQGAEVDTVLPYAYDAQAADANIITAIDEMAAGRIDAIALTNLGQVRRLIEVARARGCEDTLAQGARAHADRLGRTGRLRRTQIARPAHRHLSGRGRLLHAAADLGDGGGARQKSAARGGERLALLWQIYSRRCFSLICLLQYGHRCGRGRTMSSTMAWRTAGRLG